MVLPEGWYPIGPGKESGQGWVFHVRRRDDPSGREYALKRLKNPERFERRERFRREVLRMQRLRDAGIAGIPEIIETGLDDPDRPWFALPWFHGGSLQDAIDQGRFRGQTAAALQLLVAIAEIMLSVHAAGVAHRDLKPGNVLLGPDGSPLLTDFGLCLEADEEADRLTAIDEAVGSRLYIAPENEGGFNLEVDQRPADFYAFAKMAWTLLTGRPQLPREDARNPANHLAAILHDRRLVPLDEPLFADLLNSDPRARLQEWPAVIDDLRSVQAQLSGTPEEPPPSRPRTTINRARRIHGRLQAEAQARSEASRHSDAQRREQWFQRLVERMQTVAGELGASYGELNEALVYGIGIVTGRAGGKWELDLTGVETPSGYVSRPAATFMWELGAAAGFTIWTDTVPPLPGLRLVIYVTGENDSLWLTRILLSDIGKPVEHLSSLLLSFGGPYRAFREGTVDAAVAFVRDTGRRFQTLVDGYFRILEFGGDPLDPGSWNEADFRPRRGK